MVVILEVAGAMEGTEEIASEGAFFKTFLILSVLLTSNISVKANAGNGGRGGNGGNRSEGGGKGELGGKGLLGNGSDGQDGIKK